MNNLLKANLIRLSKSKLFYSCILIVLISSFALMLGANTDLPEEMLLSNYVLTEKYFTMLPVMGIFFSVFVSLHIGTEYSDGAIRNKIIVGHNKTSIYLSNLIINLIASIPIIFAWFVSGFLGIPAFKMGTVTLAEFSKYLFLYILSATAWISILTFISMTISKKAESSVCSILLFLILLAISSTLYNILCEPQYISNMYIGGNGDDIILNPAYCGGKTRIFFEFIVNFLPTGQAIRITNIDLTNPFAMVIFSIIIILATTLCGCILFSKKDIN